MSKPEAFGVVWQDRWMGLWLSLPKASAAEAIEAAKRIRKDGADKVSDVRAVHVAAGADVLTTLVEG